MPKYLKNQVVRANMENKETRDAETSSIEPKKQDIGRVIADIFTEPVVEEETAPAESPTPPELVSDAVGWAPSMPPGPLLLDLAAHDPHQTKVPISEAKTIPPQSEEIVLSPPENLVPRSASKRRLKQSTAIFAAAVIGAAGTTAFVTAVLFWLSR